ncbi:conserved hypothetical protein [Xanthomonas citri pv. citri]|nr:conserved hypothetical protein [Xanthomonas citri pv. citri]
MGGQGPIEMVGAHGSAKQPAEGFALSFAFAKTTIQRLGAVSSPIAGPLAAWMGCRHRAPVMDSRRVPRAGEGAAHSKCRVFYNADTKRASRTP